MRAVKGKNNLLCIISKEEAQLFSKAEFEGFLDISKLSERESYIAEDMYKKNVLCKIRRNENVGYRIYPQRAQL
jgi:hypothetical protein